MDTKSLVESIRMHHALVTRVLKRARAVSKELEKDAPNPKQIARDIDTVHQELDSSNDVSLPVREITRWLDEMRGAAEQLRDKRARTLGTELARQLEPSGLKLTGQIPDLRAGLFTIEVNPTTSDAKVWYGPRQELLKRLPADARKISEFLLSRADSLGSRLDSDDLAQCVAKAIRSANLLAGRADGDAAPIVEVLQQLQLLLQSHGFRTDPSTSKFTAYTRADFSYDIFSRGHILGVKLVVATQAKTKKRADFLWVPTDEKGNGTTYSHMRLRGETDGTHQ